jgi:hypothetical protein
LLLDPVQLQQQKSDRLERGEAHGQTQGFARCVRGFHRQQRVLAEARNTKGAGTTSEWPLIVLDDPYGMKYFLVNIYACSTTCSSIKPSNRYYSDWW